MKKLLFALLLAASVAFGDGVLVTVSLETGEKDSILAIGDLDIQEGVLLEDGSNFQMYPDTITVSGVTNPTNFNGTYTYSGTQFGFNYWSQENILTGAQITYSGSEWSIFSSAFIEWADITSTDSIVPDKTGYTTYDGFTGTPTLSYTLPAEDFLIDIGAVSCTEAIAYGSIYIEDGSDSLNLSVADTYYPVTPFTAGVVTNMILGTSNITITVAGMYELTGSLSFSGDNDTDYNLAFCTNCVPTKKGSCDIRSTAIGIYAYGQAHDIRYLEVGDTVAMAIKDLTGTTTYLSLNQSVLSVVKVTGIKGDVGEDGDTGTISTSTGLLGLTDTYDGTNYLATVEWDAEFKVLTVTETAE